MRLEVDRSGTGLLGAFTTIWPILLIGSGLYAVGACSANNSNTHSAGSGGNSASAGSGGNAGIGGIINLIDGGADSTPGSDCPDEAKLIYVVSYDSKTLYSFYPPNKAFTQVGVLSCEPSARPFAMSVARDGMAWILYEDGQLFKASTKDASCTATAYQPGQHMFTTFGMGFSSNGAGSLSEQLYVCWSQGLAAIDTNSLLLSPLGTMPGLDLTSGCDLTGTGNGDLFAFVPASSGWVIAQVDKTTTAPMWSKSLTPPIPAGGGWGTSFWGGDLYLYTTPPGSTNSTVWQFDVTAQSVTSYISDVGFEIVGAGESTCVPVTPPK